jgi:heparanase 1
MKIAGCFLLAAVSVSLAAQQNPSTMPKIGTVDARFQSYNIEMVEVIGGRFWKPYGSKAPADTKADSGVGLDPSLYEQRSPVNLSDPRLRKLAKALGPAYVRVSGSWANTVYFQDSDAPALAKPPEGFGGVLTRAEWKGVVDFAKSVDARIVTSFATSMGTRDAAGRWTPVEAKKFIDYTHSIGGSIAGAEFMNEPTFTIAAGVPKDYNATNYGQDFAVFEPFFRKAAPEALLLGPGSVGEGIEFVPMKILATKDMLEAMGPIKADGFSYHFYGAVSERCSRPEMGVKGTSPDAALTEEWLGRTVKVEEFYAGLRDTYDPGKPIWLTETGQAACGGDRWASTFLDSFRYLDQLGRLAKKQVQVVIHNTLDASDYGLIDEKTMTPRPNYWAALMWHQTMGTTVLNAGASPSESLALYAQCMKNHPGGVTLLALNLNGTKTQKFNVPGDALSYTLTSPDLMSHEVELNDMPMALLANGDVPSPKGLPTAKGELRLPAASITFFTFAGANNPACK